jgi:transposase
MLTREEDVEAFALRQQGWSISAIARHLGRDRKTVRGYLRGERQPGVRRRAEPDPVERFVPYLTARLRGDDPHVWASTLFDEVTALGFDRSYSTFTRLLRARGLRPHCEPCAASRGRDHAMIEHPPGEETQWDWVELPDPPPGWGWGNTAYLLVGALAHSGRWRGWLAESMTQPHLVEGLHEVTVRLGGLTRRWRFDRMTTVAEPGSGRISATFAAVAKHYAVTVRVCPPRHANRKGVVEKANHGAAQRWWRTLPDEVSAAAAQASLDGFCGRVGDARPRRRDGVRATVGALADEEPLRPVPPTPFPATVAVARVVCAQALVCFRGNRYSVPPGLAGRTVTVRHRLGSATLEIASEAGIVLARHRRAADGAGAVIRADEHVAALEKAVLAAFSDRPRCPRKARRPPGPAARAAATALRGDIDDDIPGDIRGDAVTDPGAGADDVVIDLARYAARAQALARRESS